MKNKKVIIAIIIVLIIIVIGTITLINNKSSKYNNFPYKNAPYLNVEYRSKYNDGCLTFRENGDYTMFDCDSEPTNYFFDSENECKYNYIEEENKIFFKCYNEYAPTKEKTIDITKWTDKEITFKLDGKEETFKSN